MTASLGDNSFGSGFDKVWLKDLSQMVYGLLGYIDSYC